MTRAYSSPVTDRANGARFATGLRRVLVIGAGSIGERHLRCFLSTGRVSPGLAEINPTLRDAIARRYDVTRTYADWQAALPAGFDAAVIATPAPLHVPMARQLVEAGLHVLIEKPLSTSLDGVDALQEAVVRRGVTAAVAYVYRAHPALAAMRDAIRAGRFGEPRQIVATCGQNFPSLRPAYRQTYYTRRASGGGAIQDALTHVLNAGEWLVGPTTHLLADADHLVVEGVDVEDTAHVLTRHGPVMGCYSLNQHQAPNEVTITVICEHGTARFEMHTGRWRWMTQPGTAWQEEPLVVLERDTLFTAQAQAFLDAIEDKRAPLCSLAEGVQTLRVNLAALSSAARLPWQELP